MSRYLAQHHAHLPAESQTFSALRNHGSLMLAGTTTLSSGVKNLTKPGGGLAITISKKRGRSNAVIGDDDESMPLLLTAPRLLIRAISRALMARIQRSREPRQPRQKRGCRTQCRQLQALGTLRTIGG
jgi:hypothetical protein